MRHHPKWLGAVGVAYLALAGAGYVTFIPLHRPEPGRLARLVVSRPPSGFNQKPASASPVSGSASDLPAVKAAAIRHPGSSGVYSVEWTKATSSGEAATLTVSLLPSVADASQAQTQATTIHLGPASLQSSSYTYAGSLAISSPPGARGAQFKSTVRGPLETVVAFQVQRAQVLEFVALFGSPAQAQSVALGLAQAEYTHLLGALPGFSLTAVIWPGVATAIYWMVAAGGPLLALSVPLALRQSRQRRHRAREAARRRELTGRGSKIVKRQASRSR